MKQKHIDEIYNAKYDLLKLRGRQIDAIRAGDNDKAAALEQQIDRRKKEIFQKYHIIL